MDMIEYIIRSHLTPGMTAFDVGANVGHYSRLMTTICAEVVAFEPNPELYPALMQHARSNLKVEALALSHAGGETSFYVDQRKEFNAMASSLLQLDGFYGTELTKEIKVKTETLDHYVQRTGRHPHFIKIDVEGWEPMVFSGGVNTIRNLRPILLFEMWEEHFPRYDEWFAWLAESHHLVRSEDGKDARAYYAEGAHTQVTDILAIPLPR